MCSELTICPRLLAPRADCSEDQILALLLRFLELQTNQVAVNVGVVNDVPIQRPTIRAVVPRQEGIKLKETLSSLVKCTEPVEH